MYISGQHTLWLCNYELEINKMYHLKEIPRLCGLEVVAFFIIASGSRKLSVYVCHTQTHTHIHTDINTCIYKAFKKTAQFICK